MLARGVLNNILLSKPGVIAFLVFLGAAAGLSRAVGPKQVEQPAGAKSASTSAGSSVVQDVRKNTPEPQQVRGIVVDLAGRPVAGAEVRVDAFTSRETPGVAGADGSFAIPIRNVQFSGWPALVRSPGDHRLGFHRYDNKPTQAEPPLRIVLKPSREIAVHVIDALLVPIAGASVEAEGDFAVLDEATTGPDGSAKLYMPADAQVTWIVALKSGAGFDYAEFDVINVGGYTLAGTSPDDLPGTVSLTLGGAERCASTQSIARTSHFVA